MALRQNILVSNANKSVLYDLNNDVQLSFPSSLFFKSPNFIELINFDMIAEISLFGNSNNIISISYKLENGEDRRYDLIVEYSETITTDYDLCQAIKTALNSITYAEKPNLLFDVTESSILNVVTNVKIEVDSSTTSYFIKSTEVVDILFDHKDSIGPLIGFGTGRYKNVKEISGTSTQSITTYNFIECFNESGDTKVYPNYNDFNCKMCLYDSNGDYIENEIDPLDSTISINYNYGLVRYSSIGKLLLEIEKNMETYKTRFTPQAEFDVNYDYVSKRVSISNRSGARFGIGFDIRKETGNISSGSLHSVLGFEQKIYLNNTTFVSPNASKTFENTFPDDYVLVCSNFGNSAADLGVLGIGNSNEVKNSNALFAVPYSLSRNFSPRESALYSVNISNSNFSLSYKNKSFGSGEALFVNFYLRTLSGRHVSSNIQWSALFSFIF
jgi:hypothetical protein